MLVAPEMNQCGPGVLDSARGGAGSMQIEIILLSPENAGSLTRIAPDVFDDDIDGEQLQAFLDDPRHLMFLAVKDETVVGMASAVELLHPDKKPQMFINEVGVAPDYRRSGIGRRLVDAVLRQAESRGCTYAWLGTEVDNISGQSCFGSVRTPDAPPQPFLLYEWDLK